MRHLKRTAKLGRTGSHRNAMLANLVCSLIQHKRITTTLAKAKAARPVAEKMVTLGKSGTVHDRRLASAKLRHHSRRMLKSKELVAQSHKNDVIRILFDEIAPAFKERRGGYTRIVKLHRRQGDASDVAILEWVDMAVAAPEQPKSETAAAEAQPAAEAQAGSEKK
jgi:large subunit ribosomal protein L17